MKCVLFAMLLGCPILCAQDPFLQWLNHSAQRQLDSRDRTIAAIKTVADAEARKKHVRETLLEILGGLPSTKAPLNARVTGRILASGYSIEKVIFESLPGFYVTANVYRPDTPGRYPAVLLPSGHTQQGKPEPQVTAANLALKGFIALTFDPVGQGEREETFVPMLGRALSGGSVNDHVHAGAQSLLAGESVARFFIHDAQRAIDYLISRPDVDAGAIGVAGCSGGGAITAYIGALDPRVKAVAPACFVDSYRLLFTGPTPDSEMSLPGFLAHGLDIADLVELSAPTPWLLLATTGDFFTPAGARMVYDEAKRWFRLYGAEDRVRLFVGSGPHGTPLETREEIYRLMIRTLKSGQGDAREQPVKMYVNHELRVTRTGHVQDEPGSRKLHQLIRDDYEAKRAPRSLDELRAELRGLGIRPSGTAPVVRVLEQTELPGCLRQRIRFESEPGVEIEGRLYVPHGAGRKKAVLLVEDLPHPVALHVSKSKATEPLALEMARAGRIVLELAPRTSESSFDGRPFVGNWLGNSRTLLTGGILPAMRAQDILRGVDLLNARPDVDGAAIQGAARGVKGIWLLLAAASDPRLKTIWVDRMPASLRSALDLPIGMELFDALIPGFALHWDLQDLVDVIGSGRVLRSDPVTWMGETIALGDAFRYRHAEEEDDLLLASFLGR